VAGAPDPAAPRSPDRANVIRPPAPLRYIAFILRYEPYLLLKYFSRFFLNPGNNAGAARRR
jgi:hypothetical protein